MPLEELPRKVRGIGNDAIGPVCRFRRNRRSLQKATLSIDNAACDLGAADIQRQEDTVRRQRR